MRLLVSINRQQIERMFPNVMTHDMENRKQLFIISVVFIAFCCAQAVFFETIAPLFLPFWLIVRERLSSFQKYAAIGGLAGAFLLGIGQGSITVLQVVLLQLLRHFPSIKIPLYVQLATAILVVQLVWQMFFYGGLPPILVIVSVGYECLFALVLLFFMNRLLPDLNTLRYTWTQDKIVAGIVVLASLLIGMKSLVVFYFSVPQILLYALICVVAYTTTIGATVIFSLALGFLIGLADLSFTGMMILYACSGLVASFVQSYGRLAVAFFSLLPSVFFFFYDATLPLDSVYFLSMLTGSLLFLFVPKSILHDLKDYYAQQTSPIVHVQRHEAVEQHLQQFQHFAMFMKELVFERFTKETAIISEQKEPFIICSSCFRYEQCFGDTKEMVPILENWRLAKRSSKPVTWVRAEEQIKNKCIKSSKLLAELQAALQKEQMERQFYHGKKMIALQLRDLTEHLQQLLKHQQQELGAPETANELQSFLTEQGFQCLHIEWLNQEMGERELILYIAGEHDLQEMMQQLEQYLFEWLHEPMQGEWISEQTTPIFYHQLKFRSAIRYQLEYDIYTYSYQDHTISGDSYRVFPLHKGLMAIMLSDGMGTSHRAQQESEHLIHMLQQCLAYNLDPETAMHTMHYVLSLKSADMYATMDFALVDLQFGHLWCWKAGGMTTYVLRGEELFKVESTCAPIGFLSDFAVDTEMVRLRADDVILMVSDGLFSEIENWVVQEQRFISSIRESLAQGATIQVALFDCMTRYKQKYEITDDCTVMLFRLQQEVKPWHVFRPNQDFRTV